MGKGDAKLEGTRLLRKLIPGVEYATAPEGTWIVSEIGEGWERVNNGANDFAVWRGYFDLAGLSHQDLSMMVAAPGWQECDEWFLGAVQGSRPLIKTWDILSKATIPNSALATTTWVNNSTPSGWSAPGMIESNFNLEEIFAGRFRMFTPINKQNALGFMASDAVAQSNETMWGAGDATAGDKIHITKIVLLTDTQDYPEGFLTVPPMSIILPLALIKEKDLVHMERLRRSYVEQNVRS